MKTIHEHVPSTSAGAHDDLECNTIVDFCETIRMYKKQMKLYVWAKYSYNYSGTVITI